MTRRPACAGSTPPATPRTPRSGKRTASTAAVIASLPSFAITAVAAVIAAAAVAVLFSGLAAGCGSESRVERAAGAIATVENEPRSADEPFARLDPAAFEERMKNEGAMVINVHIPYEGELDGTEDERFGNLTTYASRVIKMLDGHIESDSKTDREKPKQQVEVVRSTGPGWGRAPCGR